MADASFSEIEYDRESGRAIYSDVDLSFKVHPTTGDILKIKNATVIKQSMRNILQTRKFERIGHPEIGSNLSELLFDQMSPMTEARLRQTINPINPPLRVYRNQPAVFDLTDSSLGYANQATTYSAFDLNFYTDRNHCGGTSIKITSI